MLLVQHRIFVSTPTREPSSATLIADALNGRKVDDPALTFTILWPSLQPGMFLDRPHHIGIDNYALFCQISSILYSDKKARSTSYPNRFMFNMEVVRPNSFLLTYDCFFCGNSVPVPPLGLIGSFGCLGRVTLKGQSLAVQALKYGRRVDGTCSSKRFRRRFHGLRKGAVEVALCEGPQPVELAIITADIICAAMVRFL